MLLLLCFSWGLIFGQKPCVIAKNNMSKEKISLLNDIIKKYNSIHSIDHDTIFIEDKFILSNYNSREVIRVIAQVSHDNKNTVLINVSYKNMPDFLLKSVFTHELFHTFKSKEDTLKHLFKKAFKLLDARNQEIYITGYQGLHVTGTIDGKETLLTQIIEEGFAELLSLYIDPANFSTSHGYLESANILKVLIKKGILRTGDIIQIRREGDLKSLVSKIVNKEATDEQIFQFGRIFILVETGAINVSQQYRYIQKFIEVHRIKT